VGTRLGVEKNTPASPDTSPREGEGQAHLQSSRGGVAAVDQCQGALLLAIELLGKRVRGEGEHAAATRAARIACTLRAGRLRCCCSLRRCGRRAAAETQRKERR
jgi:hypothetical protein